jgi:peroxiredoxin
MKARTGWLLAFSLAVGLPVWAGPQEAGEEPGKAEIGKPAPEFTLEGLDGKEYKLADFKDKIVVLEWINHECPVVNGCHKKGLMSETIKQFKDKPVVWIAIDSSHFCKDKAESVGKWVEAQKIEYPYLLDPEGKVGHLYGAQTTPHMFVIDQKGTLAYTGALNDRDDEARNYVAEAVTSLLNGSTVATSKTKPYGCTVKYKS